ncbi:PQQ-binding-like beta-propeller repeat protein [Mucilaginibacter sp. CSA2-8R]|uniref:outer membrane protein assembly factor BamB family protein n=1 Tax=Mucilaginibacter sp. CSA2-8R TaxID=3141542 RepID=UPI00315D400A
MPKPLRINIIIIALITMAGLIAGCKKNNPQDEIPTTTKPVSTPLPDLAMFVNTFDSSSGTTTYFLNAATGNVLTQYTYPAQTNTTWCQPVAGNGYLYNSSNNKIDAINMNTGSVVWTDDVTNVSAPILHDDTFYGVYTNANDSYGIYALDATKPSKTFLWKYEVNKAVQTQYPGNINVEIKYYNGLIYIAAAYKNIAAVDAKTGVLKWQMNTVNYVSNSLIALNNGFIINEDKVIDAATGQQIWMAKPAALPPTFTGNQELAKIEYVTKDLYFVATTHYPSSPGNRKCFLSAIDKTTGNEKWHTNYGGGYSNYDTINAVTQVWNNQLLIKKLVYTGAGKYGANVDERYLLMDIATGRIIVTLSDTGAGTTSGAYIINNDIFFCKRWESTLHGVFGPVSPPANYVFTNDLLTGKQKWNNNKLLENYQGTAYSCVVTGGKAYSPLIH